MWKALAACLAGVLRQLQTALTTIFFEVDSFLPFQNNTCSRKEFNGSDANSMYCTFELRNAIKNSLMKSAIQTIVLQLSSNTVCMMIQKIKRSNCSDLNREMALNSHDVEGTFYF